MGPSTTMMAYSMTKTFTAATVMQIVGAGKLGLDDRVDAVFPSTPYGRSMTIRHLLSQTSGIPNPIPLRWVHLAQHHAAFDERRALDEVLHAHPSLRFAPGTRYGYSNISYWILGKIVERVSGKALPDYMRDHVFTPLRLSPSDAGFVIPGNAPHAKGYIRKYSFMNLAKPLLIDAEFIGKYEGNWLHLNDHYLNGPGFGGLIATARGVATFLQDQLREESVLFDKETKELFFSQQRTTAGEPIDMTLGWHIKTLDDGNYFYKEGGGGGYHAEMRIYPASGIASVIMVNETSAQCTRMQTLFDSRFIRG
jgi:CubicO group peptidase (beta-lactamase class C family)